MHMRQAFNVLIPLPQHLRQFRQLYKKRFGIQLTPDQARPLLMSLLVVTKYRQRNLEYKGQKV